MIVTFLTVGLMMWMRFEATGGVMSWAWAVRIAMLHFTVGTGVGGRLRAPVVVRLSGITLTSGLEWGNVQCRVGSVGGRG